MGDGQERRGLKITTVDNGELSEIIIDIAQDMIVAVDGVRGIHVFNKAAERTYGYSYSEVVGKPVGMLYGSPSEAQMVGETMHRHGQFHGEVMGRKKNGEIFPTRIAAKLLKNDRGEIIGSVGYSRDLTAEREAEAVKREYAALLEVDRLKKDVEHITRHDMKSPLNGVVGLADLLLNDQQFSSRHRELVQAIRDSGTKALRMINLSLDVLKMEMGTYELAPHPVKLGMILRELLIDNASQIRIKRLGVSFHLDGAPMDDGPGVQVLGEEAICHNLFANLFKNAVEASPAGGVVTVSITRGDQVAVALHNAGAVPVEIRDRFFEKYVTAGKRTGTGLGTYSARLMAETLGGGIRLHSSKAAGTTVTVSLPGV